MIKFNRKVNFNGVKESVVVKEDFLTLRLISFRILKLKQYFLSGFNPKIESTRGIDITDPSGLIVIDPYQDNKEEVDTTNEHCSSDKVIIDLSGKQIHPGNSSVSRPKEKLITTENHESNNLENYHCSENELVNTDTSMDIPECTESAPGLYHPTSASKNKSHDTETNQLNKRSSGTEKTSDIHEKNTLFPFNPQSIKIEPICHFDVDPLASRINNTEGDKVNALVNGHLSPGSLNSSTATDLNQTEGFSGERRLETSELDTLSVSESSSLDNNWTSAHSSMYNIPMTQGHVTDGIFFQQVSTTGISNVKTPKSQTASKYDISNAFIKLSPHKRYNPMQLSEGEYKCSKCGKGFSLKTTKMRHERFTCGKERSECSFCGKMFSRLDSLQRHHAKMHGVITSSKQTFLDYTL